MTSKRDKIKAQIRAKRKKTFIRSESWRYKRLQTSWRKPKGIETTMRIYHNGNAGGYPKNPSIGYRTPRAIRGLHPSGYEAVLIHNEADLDRLRPRTHAIIIASKVGRKKKIQLKEVVLGKGFTLLNPGIIMVSEELAPELEAEFGDIDQTVGEIEDIELTDEDLEDIDDDVDDVEDLDDENDDEDE